MIHSLLEKIKKNLFICIAKPFVMKYFKIYILFFSILTSSLIAQNSFTENDRKTLLDLSVKMSNLEQRQLELREDMNKRFEQIDKRFEQVNKRFEQIDKRFEQVERAIDRVYTVLTILSGIFASLIAGMFWFLYTERKPQLEAIKQLNDKVNILESTQLMLLKVLATLREVAIKDEKLREALTHNT